MARNLVLRLGAEQDIVAAGRWYSEQRSPLGDELLDEVFATIRNVVSSPFKYPVVFRRTRRALVRRFPYGVYFRLTGQTVVIIAVLHTRRDPRRWQAREATAAYHPTVLAA